MIPDYYSVLGVPENATDDAIRAAYLQLVRRYHPDVNKSAGAEERIREINLAYESLCDPIRRKHYDRAIQVLRDEQARLAVVERMRAAQTSPTPPPTPQPRPPVPSAPPRTPTGASFQSAPIRPRPAGMRSGKVVLATVLLVALAMLVATRFDVPVKGAATFAPSDQLPHVIPTSTPATLTPSLILPAEAPTVAPLGQARDTDSTEGTDASAPSGPLNVSTYIASLMATNTALLDPSPSPTRLSVSDVATLTSDLYYRTPTPEN